MWYRGLVVATVWASLSGARAAEMSVADLSLKPGTSAALAVSGRIADESTFGWSVMLRLVPRDGARGSLEFTPVPYGRQVDRPTVAVLEPAGAPATIRLTHRQPPELDIQQVQDVWPNLGSFTPFDTQRSGSSALNGAVDDNGTLVGAPVTFSGVLATFPVRASSDADGVWDVLLFTDVGASGFEGVTTKLIFGSVAVTPTACASANDCDDQDPCTRDSCGAGACRHAYNERDCRRARGAKRQRGTDRN
ncbi:MAG: hypothetical protein ACE5E5_14610 [Phycisphaerae bacterium]